MTTSHSASTEQNEQQDTKSNTEFTTAAEGTVTYFHSGPATAHREEVWSMSREEKFEHAMNGGMY